MNEPICCNFNCDEGRQCPYREPADLNALVVEPLCSAIEELRTIRRTALYALVAGLGTLAAIWFAIANLP